MTVAVIIRRFAASIAVLALLSAPLRAEQIQVPGDFVVLQDAIDAASPGDVIIISGGEHLAVVIDKPLSLVGENSDRPFIRSLTPPELGGGPQQSPVSLAGPRFGTVTLSALDLGGTSHADFSNNVPAISGGGFDELRVLHCDVRAPTWEDTGSGQLKAATPGIDVDTGWLLIEDSTVRGTGPVLSDAFQGIPVPSGAAGIISTGDVSVFDSDVQGAPALDVFDQWPFEGGCNDGFPFGPQGVGGAGIVTPGTLHRANSEIQGGAGAVITGGLPGFGTVLLCIHDDGPDTIVGQEVDLSGQFLFGSGPLVANSSWQLALQGGDFLLLIGTQPGPPVAAGSAGLLFMDPQSMIVTIDPFSGSGLNVLTLTIGASTSVLGIPIALQVYSAGGQLSRPVFATILPE